MSFVSGLLPYIQIVLSILLIVAVLLQRSEAGLGAAFGGDSFSSTQHTKRGFEKVLFNSTIIIACLFALASFITLILK
ncbi:MAG: preprotein translocase subunit SecG [Parcubacteria group bacterium]|nr:preprotein translocase subunit SecG [Parcubacteria group bacterium]